jgi:C4-dicarboxylate-specific signal transduction histidine kinase
VGIGLDADETTAIIEVWDTGPGLPEEFGEKLPEPFFTTKAGQDGLGLGLSISQSILADYGAKMRFLPRDGGGTICEVRLPLAVDGERIEAAE